MGRLPLNDMGSLSRGVSQIEVATILVRDCNFLVRMKPSIKNEHFSSTAISWRFVEEDAPQRCASSLEIAGVVWPERPGPSNKRV